MNNQCIVKENRNKKTSSKPTVAEYLLYRPDIFLYSLNAVSHLRLLTALGKDNLLLCFLIPKI